MKKIGPIALSLLALVGLVLGVLWSGYRLAFLAWRTAGPQGDDVSLSERADRMFIVFVAASCVTAVWIGVVAYQITRYRQQRSTDARNLCVWCKYPVPPSSDLCPECGLGVAKTDS